MKAKANKNYDKVKIFFKQYSVLMSKYSRERIFPGPLVCISSLKTMSTSVTPTGFPFVQSDLLLTTTSAF